MGPLLFLTRGKGRFIDFSILYDKGRCLVWNPQFFTGIPYYINVGAIYSTIIAIEIQNIFVVKNIAISGEKKLQTFFLQGRCTDVWLLYDKSGFVPICDNIGRHHTVTALYGGVIKYCIIIVNYFYGSRSIARGHNLVERKVIQGCLRFKESYRL